jgi:hypothetical protein
MRKHFIGISPSIYDILYNKNDTGRFWFQKSDKEYYLQKKHWILQFEQKKDVYGETDEIFCDFTNISNDTYHFIYVHINC